MRETIDFIGIGAGRAGSTWLWENLQRHPQVFMPEDKELYYFNSELPEDVNARNPNFGKPVSWYLAKFANARPEQICGEITPVYIWSKSAPAAIHAFNPGIKLLVTIREPVDRLFSDYLYRRQMGMIGPMTFKEFVEKYEFMVEWSYFGQFLSTFFSLFPREQICVVRFEDIKKRPVEVIDRVVEFLGIDRLELPVGKENVNPSGVPVYPLYSRLFRQVRLFARRSGMEPLVEWFRQTPVGLKLKSTALSSRPYEHRPTLDPDVAQRLRGLFHDDIGRIEALTGLDLASWKDARPVPVAATPEPAPAR